MDWDQTSCKIRPSTLLCIVERNEVFTESSLGSYMTPYECMWVGLSGRGYQGEAGLIEGRIGLCILEPS